MPALRCSIHEKISRCDADDWDDVVRASRSDILMSHEFVAAVEEAFDDQARFAHAVVYDDRRPVACGSLCAFPIDFNLLADGSAANYRDHQQASAVPDSQDDRLLWPPGLGRCQASGDRAGARHQDVLRAMHEHAVSFARRERAPYIVFKEFSARDRPAMDFLRATRLPAFLIPGDEHVQSPVF